MDAEERWLTMVLHSLVTHQHTCQSCLTPTAMKASCKCTPTQCCTPKGRNELCTQYHHPMLHIDADQRRPAFSPHSVMDYKSEQIVIHMQQHGMLHEFVDTPQKFFHHPMQYRRIQVAIVKAVQYSMSTAKYNVARRRQNTFCLACWENHDTAYCLLKGRYDWETIAKRISKVTRQWPCENCFMLHSTHSCTQLTCSVCAEKHNSLLHQERYSPSTLV